MTLAGQSAATLLGNTRASSRSLDPCDEQAQTVRNQYQSAKASNIGPGNLTYASFRCRSKFDDRAVRG